MTSNVIHIAPEILGGTPVFRGTRVPIQNLFDYLEGGETLDEFLDDFPSVSREQTLEVLQLAETLVTSPKP
jgi:uncharacterized protein (DUF433 family)